MAAPHRPDRIGELWPAERIRLFLEELDALKLYVTLSGGWAWHFMTPAGHTELKHAHDHKDVDIFVRPEQFTTLALLLKNRGFQREWTRFDSDPASKDFYRYTRQAEGEDRPYKLILDVFVEEIPAVEAGDYRVVEPEHLLSLYGKKHSSDRCFSVQIARRLLARGLNPVGHPEMADYRAFLPK